MLRNLTSQQPSAQELGNDQPGNDGDSSNHRYSQHERGHLPGGKEHAYRPEHGKEKGPRSIHLHAHPTLLTRINEPNLNTTDEHERIYANPVPSRVDFPFNPKYREWSSGRGDGRFRNLKLLICTQY
ncbi:MAG: hypothetical protein U1F39_10780 [Steroidobacteraceae bacterium]